ncbi:secreted aspartic protease [Aspergillus sclerotiicarbonarius CBS 121057]|uniref:Probable aspartic-type endopeptidase OPSB n=1 Tax=Aspergillus sclerotiicarbonarius (strain CBS 121057 / IBT 28362) TaxID=1448318 RepID=A0A319F0B5_ASPSB|nr:secreted aspartic protease [Aspergillus sclerotiicarbonarius CBS 121057]
MKSTTLLSLAWATQSAYALSLHQRDEPAALALNFERRQIADRPRRKRSTASAELVNLAANLGYTMNITLGTPGQKVSVTLDTGSSDLWVNAGNSSACPCDYGTYNSSDSSTYEYVNDEFEIQYVDNSEAIGDYVNDTLQFANVTLTSFTFAVAYDSDSDEGVFGIGYAADEASQESDYGTYTNFPEALVDQGVINWPAYSLWLDDLEKGEGTILFGGVNTAKYYGSLQTLPIIPESDGYEEVYAEFAVNLTAVHLEKSGKAVSVNNTAQQFPISAVLDSGTALAYIPSSAAESIFDAVGADYSNEYGYAVVDCSLKNEDFTFYFEFASQFNITVDISEMVIADEGSANICTFGLSTIDDEALLGDTFLRSAYVVYDLGNNEVSIAQANFDPGTDNVLEIGTGSNAVPNATGASQSTSSGSKSGSSSTGTSASDSKKESLATMSRSDLVSLVAGLAVTGFFLTL